jgi:hypothetical protein
MPRGLINNHDHIKKPVDYIGLKNGSVHPTDIDLLLEFDKKFLILGEIKARGADIPTGQRLVIERLCDVWDEGDGRKSVGVSLCFTRPENNVIIAADCIVKSVYYGGNGSWYDYDLENNPMNFMEFLNRLSHRWDIQKLKK